MAEVIEPTSTAAAAKSFIFLMPSFLLGSTKSARFSMAEFSISKANTNPIHSISTNHSVTETLKNKPAITTRIEMKK